MINIRICIDARTLAEMASGGKCIQFAAIPHLIHSLNVDLSVWYRFILIVCRTRMIASEGDFFGLYQIKFPAVPDYWSSIQ
jgi:hypothetical protein